MLILEAIRWAIVALNAIGLLVTVATVPSAPKPQIEPTPVVDSYTHESFTSPDAP